MFSLIITIISIALVAALALATLYYGGSAFNKGTVGATAARLINEGQQINGAVQVYKADVSAGSIDGTVAATITTVADLADAAKLTSGTYMSQLPKDWDGTSTLAGGTIKLTADAAGKLSTEVCNEVNIRAGYATGATVAATTGSVYGCLTADKEVFYNF